MVTLTDCRYQIIYYGENIGSIRFGDEVYYIKQTGDNKYCIENFEGDDGVTIKTVHVDDEHNLWTSETTVWAWDNDRACIGIETDPEEVLDYYSMDRLRAIETMLYMKLLDSPLRAFYEVPMICGKYSPDFDKLLIHPGRKRHGILLMDGNDFLEWTREHHSYRKFEDLINAVITRGVEGVKSSSWAYTDLMVLPSQKVAVVNVDHVRDWDELISDAEVIECKYLVRILWRYWRDKYTRLLAWLKYNCPLRVRKPGRC